MTREHIARIALHAYPESVRAAKGPEMLGTLLDVVGGVSGGAFGREIVDLLAGGIRARVTTPTHASARRLVADGFCIAGIWMIALIFASRAGASVSFGATVLGAKGLWELAVLGASLAAASVGYDRIAAIGGLVCLALVPNSRYFAAEEKILLATFAVPAACFVVMLVKPRRRSRRVRRLSWLIPVAGLGVLAGGVGPSTYLILAPLAVAVPVALARLAHDPRLAIACSVFAAEIAMASIGRGLEGGPVPIGLPLTGLLLALTPVAVALTAHRVRPLQPGDPA